MLRALAGSGAGGLKTGVYAIVNEDFQVPGNKVLPNSAVLHQTVTGTVNN
jgi:hypothetical protein